MNKETKKKVIIGIIAAVLLLVGLGVGLYLVQQQQNTQQEAADPETSLDTTANPFGKVLRFDGTTSYFTIPKENLPVTQQPFTVEMWLRPNPASSKIWEYILSSDKEPTSATCVKDFQIIGYNYSIDSVSSASAGVQIAIGTESDATNNLTEVLNGTGSDAAKIPLNQWSHVAFSIDSSGSGKLFYNGVEVAQKQYTTPLCIDNAIKVGAGRDLAPANFYTGDIDELRFSNTARYTTSFAVPTTPYTADATTTSLLHFNDNLTETISNATMPGIGGLTYISATIPTGQTPSPTATTIPTPACFSNIASCEWDPLVGAGSYNYKITQTNNSTVIKEGVVESGVTKVTFEIAKNVTYRCEVSAVNSCGPGAPSTATQACVENPTPTPTPTVTVIPPSPTPTLPPVVPPSPTPTPRPTNPPVVPPTAIPTTRPQGSVQQQGIQPTSIPQQVVVVTQPPQPTLEPTGTTEVILGAIGGLFVALVGAVLFFVL